MLFSTRNVPFGIRKVQFYTRIRSRGTQTTNDTWIKIWGYGRSRRSVEAHLIKHVKSKFLFTEPSLWWRIFRFMLARSRLILPTWTLFIVLLAFASEIIEFLCCCLAATAWYTFFLRFGLSFFAVIRTLSLRSREFQFLIQYYLQENKYK